MFLVTSLSSYHTQDLPSRLHQEKICSLFQLQSSEVSMRSTSINYEPRKGLSGGNIQLRYLDTDGQVLGFVAVPKKLREVPSEPSIPIWVTAGLAKG